MGDVKLFRFSDGESRELAPRSALLERGLQTLVEKHMERFLGIRLLAHEYRVGREHRGAIDSLGIDENGCPVIIEYKRFNDENVICQGLYYLDWLLDHQAQFAALAKEKLGEACPGQIEFDGARILCIARNFSRYDERAIMQIDRNIELIRYRFFEEDMILLEMLNTSISTFLGDSGRAQDSETPRPDGCVGMPAPLQKQVRSMTDAVEALYLELLAFAENLGDDATIKFLRRYIAVSRFRNVACIQPMKNLIKIWLNLDPAQVILEEGFSRDVTNVGHLGTGNLELDVRDAESLERARPLIELAYERN